MGNYEINEIGIKTFGVKENTSGASAYVVCGAERAVVIDTWSNGDIRCAAENLVGTDVPMFCILTRVAQDSAGGAYTFDEAYSKEKDLDKQGPETIPSAITQGRIRVGTISDGDHFHLGGVHVGIWDAPGPWSDRVCVRMTREGVFTATFAGDYLEFAEEIIGKFCGFGRNEYIGKSLTARDVKFTRRDMVIYAEGVISLSAFIDKEEIVYSAHSAKTYTALDLQFVARQLKNVAHRIGEPEETTMGPEALKICDGVVVGYNPEPGYDEIVIPEGVSAIGDRVFYESNLYKVVFPSSLTTIGNSAFESSRWLVDAKLPDGVERLGERCFAITGLEKVNITQGITVLPKGAFDGCMGYEELLVPAHVKRIGELCFSANRRVKKVTIEEGVQEIGRRAFNGNPDMQSLYFPNSVEVVEPYAFDGSGAPKSVTVTGKTKNVWTEFMCGNMGIEEVTLEEGVEEIGVRAFAYCRNLRKVVIPSTLKKIDYRAFSGCSSLENIELPKGIKIAEHAFYACPAGKTISI